MSRSFDTLLDVIDTLLGPNGCPWDKEQTPHTLSDYIIEEAFELVEAIRDNNPREAAEELGDLMFLLCFVARCYQNQDAGFTVDDSLDMIRRKMIRRHPHVFGEETVNGSGEVLANWEKIKRAE
ncbi:MAG: MazG nucleotide pyrophosphohydrolase domain-containing protein, partial [Oceanidesulfovibrio sp.]